MKRPIPLSEPGDLEIPYTEHFKVWTEIERFNPEGVEDPSVAEYETMDVSCGDNPTFSTLEEAEAFGTSLYDAYYGLLDIWQRYELEEGEVPSGVDVLTDVFELMTALGMEVA